MRPIFCVTSWFGRENLSYRLHCSIRNALLYVVYMGPKAHLDDKNKKLLQNLLLGMSLLHKSLLHKLTLK